MSDPGPLAPAPVPSAAPPPTTASEPAGTAPAPDDRADPRRLEDEAARATGPVAPRLWVEAGWRWLDRQDRASAERCFTAAREREPSYQPARDSLRSLLAETGEWERVAELYRQELETVTDTAERFEILRAEAAVYEQKLGQPERAAKVLAEAQTLVPDHPVLLERAIVAATARQDAADEVSLRARLGQALTDDTLKARNLSRAAFAAEKQRDAETASGLRRELIALAPLDLEAQATCLAGLFKAGDQATLERIARAEVAASSGTAARVRLARLVEGRGEDGDEARELLGAAREINPRDGLALEAFIDHATRAGDDAALESSLAARLETARDPLDKAGAALRLARHLDHAGRPDEAAAHYARVLELVPNHPEALAATEAKAPLKTVDEELTETRAALGQAADPAARADLACRSGLLLEELGRFDEAIGAYLEALVHAPTHLAAHDALCAVYARTEKWAPLSQLYEKDYLLAGSREGKRAVLLDMAELAESKLGEPASAQAAYRLALEMDPSMPVSRALVRCALAAKDWREAAAGLEKEAEVAEVPERKPGLLQRAADLQARALGNLKEAVRLYKSVLGEQKGYVPALRGLELVARVRPELVLSPEDAAGRAREREAAKQLAAKSWDGAATSLSALLEKHPGHPTAWADLARAATARGDPSGAAAAWEKYAGLLTDPIAKAEALQRAAEIAEEQLFDPARALALTEAAVAAAPRQASAWRMLSRLALAKADHSRARQALEQEVQVAQLKDRTVALRRLAALVADRFGEPGRAIELYRESLEEDGSDLATMAELDRLHLLTGDRLKSAEIRGRLAARCRDVRAAAYLRTAAALDRATAGDPDGAINEYRRALAVDGRIRFALDEVQVALRQKPDHAGLVDLYLRRAPYLDLESQAFLAFSRGKLHQAAGQAALALKAFEDALALDPKLVPAMRAAARLHGAAGAWREVVDLLTREAQAQSGPETAAGLHFDAATVAREHGDLARFEAALRQTLAARPADGRALAALDALFGQQDRFADLAALLEAAAASEPDAAKSAALFLRVARLQHEKLGDRAREAEALEQALARAPLDLTALEMKADYALVAGNPAAAVEPLTKALEVAGADRARLQVRLADAHLAAGQGAEALVAARAAFEEKRTAERLELVARAAMAAGEHQLAQAAFDRLLQTARDPASGARFARQAARCKQAQKDTDGAAALFRRAVELLPGDTEALQGLEALYLSSGDSAGLAGAYETLAGSEALRPADAVAYLAQAAQAWEAAGTSDRATAMFERALQADPGSSALRLSFARFLGRAPTTRARALNELRLLVSQAPLSLNALRELASLFAASGQPDGAFLALAALVGLGAATEEESLRHAQAAKARREPVGALSPADVELCVHPLERAAPIREAFVALAAALPKIVPGSLERHGLGKNDRFRGEGRAAADRLAKLFGTGPFELYRSSPAQNQAWVENTVPPSLVVGATRLAGEPGELLFTLGMLLGRVRLGTHAAFFAQPIEVANLVAEALRQADPAFSRFGTKSPELAQAVGRAVGRAERKALEALVPKFAGTVSFGAATQGMAFSSHRFGLVAAGDLAAAIRVLARDEKSPAALLERPDLVELVGFALSDEHLALRGRLRTAVG